MMERIEIYEKKKFFLNSVYKITHVLDDDGGKVFIFFINLYATEYERKNHPYK